FRRDLYYRMNAAVVTLPPLRERPRDIPVLARAFLDDACRRLGRPPMRISDAALRGLAALRFPGNVRELVHAIEYAATVTPDEVLEMWHLPGSAATAPSDDGSPAFRSIAEEVEELERRRMREALDAAGGNQSRAADLISMPRRTFVTKLGKYGLR
ncbi:MAG TPA: helix-turn-helix domain-containing protein, partial [Xanthomonadales bacterium]|nr:helix-turn-helix domain-containing protein [Xanthomonadales bacterium]